MIVYHEVTDPNAVFEKLGSRFGSSEGLYPDNFYCLSKK